MLLSIISSLPSKVAGKSAGLLKAKLRELDNLLSQVSESERQIYFIRLTTEFGFSPTRLADMSTSEIIAIFRSTISAHIARLAGISVAYVENLTNEELWNAYLIMKNPCPISDITCFPDPFEAKYATGTNPDYLVAYMYDDQGRMNYYVPGSQLGTNQELRQEIALASVEIWTHYGYFLNTPITSLGEKLTALDTLVMLINRFEHNFVSASDPIAIYPPSYVSVTQQIIAFDFISNINSAFGLGFPFLLEGIPIEQQKERFDQYIGKLNTYLTVPGSLQVDLDRNEPIANWFKIALSEWTVILTRVSRDGRANLRTGMAEQRLLVPLASNQVQTFVNVGNITDYNHYQLYQSGQVAFNTSNGPVLFSIPASTQTWGSTEFTSTIVRDLYWDADQVGSITLPCQKNRKLHSGKLGPSSSNSVYFLNNLEKELLSEIQSLNAQSREAILQHLCSR